MFLFKFFLILFIKRCLCINLNIDNQLNEPIVEYNFQNGWFENNLQKDNHEIFEFDFIKKFQIILTEKFIIDDIKELEINLDFNFFNKHPIENEKINFLIKILGEEKEEFDKNVWINYNKKFEITKDFNFELKFFETQIDKLKDDLNNNLFSNTKKIYIKNFYLKFKFKILDDHETKFKLSENIFKIYMNDKEIAKDLKEFSFLPEINENSKKYFYTTENSITFTWTISNILPDLQKDICLSFEYYIKRRSTLKVKFLNKLKTSYLLLTDLTNSEIRINEKLSKVEWLSFRICLRDLLYDSESIENDYKFRFETVFDKNPKSLGFVAISEIKYNEVKSEFFEKKNYLTNWKNDGSYAINEWFLFTSNFKKKIKDNSLSLKFQRLPFIEQKRFFITSNWLTFEENERLIFEYESNFDGLTLVIQVLDYQMTPFPVGNSAIMNKGKDKLYFKFSTSLSFLLKNRIGKIKISFLQSPFYTLESNHYIKISNLYLSDPCHDENICNKNGKCITTSANQYVCKCLIEFVGKNCEFKNKCLEENENKKTGIDYCKEHNGNECIPVDDTFSCKCHKNYQWNKFIKDCQKIEKCFFKFCKKNEKCIESKGKAVCVCKNNYHKNKITQECEFDLCEGLVDKNKCPENEKCLSVIGETSKRCFCPIENSINGGVCKNEKLIDNPFIKQLYECSQTYTVIDNEIKCSCFDGYELSEDGKSCKNNLEDKCKPECDKSKQLCVLVDKGGKKTYECKCLLGLLGENCQTNYCDIAHKSEVKNICGVETCRGKFTNDNLKFVCRCNHETTVNDENGLCKLRKVCDDENINKCKEINANCVTQFDDWQLKPSCVCPKGHYLNKNNKCKYICDIKKADQAEIMPYKDFCTVNFDNNDKTYECRNGFTWDEEKNKCIAGENLFYIQFKMKLKTNDLNLENKVFEYNSNDYYCEDLSFKEDCVKKLNSERIEENKLLEEDILKDIRNKIEIIVSKSFVNLIQPESIKQVRVQKVNSKENNDFLKDGLNTIYEVELLVNSGYKEKADDILETFKQVCIEDTFNTKEDNSNGNCLIMPYIYVIDSNLIVKEENLCDKNLIDCKKNSYCSHRKTETGSHYNCLCSAGYEEKFVFDEENNINLSLCTDIDECQDSTLNNCDPDSTVCQNLSGSYKCNCKENYKIINNTFCEAVCNHNTKCTYGVCKVFEKNFEVCECFDGYKGETCNKLDSKVIDLRTNLATVTIVFSLLMIIIIVKTFLYVKKIESEEEQHLTKRVFEVPMDDLENNNYKLGIKNLTSRSSSNVSNEDSFSINSQKNVTSF